MMGLNSERKQGQRLTVRFTLFGEEEKWSL